MKRIVVVISLLFFVCCANIQKAKAADAEGINVPQGGTYIALAPVFGQDFLLKNGTGKEAHDVTLTWLDKNKNPKGGSQDNTGIKSFIDSTGVMTKPIEGREANGIHNPIRYECKKGQNLGPDGTIRIDLNFRILPSGTDLLYVGFTDPNGRVVREKIETKSNDSKNDSKEQGLNLGEGDYLATIGGKADVDYFSFKVVDDNTLVNLSVAGSGGALLMELLDQDGTVLASDNDSMLGRIKTGEYSIRISGSPQNYLIRQSTTTAATKAAEARCLEDDSGALDIAGSHGMTNDEIIISVRIQSASNAILSFGFEVTFNPEILQYSGFTEGDLTGSFEMLKVSSCCRI